MNVLKQAHICYDIFVEKLGGIISNVMTNNYITFTNDEILFEGMRHNKPFRISMKCKYHVIARVLWIMAFY